MLSARNFNKLWLVEGILVFNLLVTMYRGFLGTVSRQKWKWVRLANRGLPQRIQNCQQMMDLVSNKIPLVSRHSFASVVLAIELCTSCDLRVSSPDSK